MTPSKPKLYHIVHIDRLPSIVADGFLWCDAEVAQRPPQGTAIGMHAIKHRRLTELKLTSHPDLHVGDCVPFYFCPRSVMLYLIHQANHPDLAYRGGQDPIVHLEADLHEVVAWANREGRRWAFTTSNAGSHYFEDFCDLASLAKVDWQSVQARDWRKCRGPKQAEFLLERRFPWRLVERIGVRSKQVRTRVLEALAAVPRHCPPVEIRADWYY